MKVSMDPMPKLRGYAQRIKTAIHNRDRNDIELLDSQLLWSSPFECDLEHITKWLVYKQLLTPTERNKALALMPNINNPSCSS